MRILLALIFIFFFFNTFSQKVTGVTAVAYTVSDTERAVTFLKNTVDAKIGTSVILRGENLQRLYGLKEKSLSLKITEVFIGKETVQLLEFNASKEGKEIPADSKSNDLWFQHIAIVVKDMDKAYAQVKEQKVEHVSTSPQVLPDYIPAAAGIAAFYFRDKDDHNLELIYFPKDKGNPKWKASSNDLFLGIDHTAIGIKDTEVSMTFYKEVLGLKVAGNSENYGSEQEHLNQVFGARLLITGLHADEGFGVEFLDYIAPPGGKPYPENTSSLDHWYWHTAMEVDDLNLVYKKLQKHNYKIISSGIQTIPELGYHKSLIVRDPDGHAVLLYEKSKPTNDE